MTSGLHYLPEQSMHPRVPQRTIRDSSQGRVRQPKLCSCPFVTYAAHTYVMSEAFTVHTLQLFNIAALQRTWDSSPDLFSGDSI